ncbi:MAG: cytochrome P450 [Acidimicrobiia bacterium]|nr:cytochrome P450 [Acidimicrobiia bacterium]MDH5290986.1 cytochrome P450 [Acidimicrobiia bacterium]
MAATDHGEFDHHETGLTEAARYARYAQLRACPVEHSDRHGGFWITGRHAEVEAICRDWATFASGQGVFIPDLTPGIRSAGLEQDPPEHTRIRRLFVEMLGRPAVRAAEPEIRAITRRHVTAFAEAGGGDFMAGVAVRVPVEAIAVMAGFSGSTVARVRELTEQLWNRLTGRGTPPQPGEPTLGRLFIEEANLRRVEPRDDFLTRLAAEDLTDRELVAFLTSTAVAGHETTMAAMGNLAYQLAGDPVLQARLAAADGTGADDRGALAARLVEESLRHRSPVQLMARTAVVDTTVGGEAVAAGQRVVVHFGAANRDQARWGTDPDRLPPDEFDPDRDATGHLAFGWGLHRCVGAFLATLELRLLVEELAGYELAVASEPAPPVPTAGGSFMGFEHLDLAITPWPARGAAAGSGA